MAGQGAPQAGGQQVGHPGIAKSHFGLLGVDVDVEVGRRLEFNAKKTRVTVEFTVKEGTRYRVASVAVRGAEKLDPGYLAKEMNLQPGEFYTAESLKADGKRITDSYGRVGYVHAGVRPRTEFTTEEGKLDIVFEVTEGPKITIGEIKVTGNKVKQKVYYRHSGYPGGLKSITLEKLMQTNPARVIEYAVKGMLPHTRLGASMRKKLRVYTGDTNPHLAQTGAASMQKVE